MALPLYSALLPVFGKKDVKRLNKTRVDLAPSLSGASILIARNKRKQTELTEPAFCSSSLTPPRRRLSSLFHVYHYERCSIPTCHQKVHTDPGAMTLNSFVQHAIPSPFCLVLTVWQLLHVGSGRKNVHVALSVTSICGGYVDRY